MLLVDPLLLAVNTNVRYSKTIKQNFTYSWSILVIVDRNYDPKSHIKAELFTLVPIVSLLVIVLELMVFLCALYTIKFVTFGPFSSAI